MQFYETFDNAQWRKVNKCNQFDNASSRAGHLRNKCKQCDFISNQAGYLRRHLKTRSGEKSNKSNQCDYMSSCAYNLRTHLKNIVEKLNKWNQCEYAYKQMQTIWGHIWKHTVEKSYTNVTGMTLPPLGQTLDLDWNLYIVMVYKML